MITYCYCYVSHVNIERHGFVYTEYIYKYICIQVCKSIYVYVERDNTCKHIHLIVELFFMQIGFYVGPR